MAVTTTPLLDTAVNSNFSVIVSVTVTVTVSVIVLHEKEFYFTCILGVLLELCLLITRPYYFSYCACDSI